MLPPLRSRPIGVFVIGLTCAVLLYLLSDYYTRLRTTIQVPSPDSGHRNKANRTVTVNTHVPSKYYDQTVSEFYSDVIDKWFAPWDCLCDPSTFPTRVDTVAPAFCQRPITDAAISALEIQVQPNAYRIRLTQDQRILYRPLQVSHQTYQVQRANWTMTLLTEMIEEGLLTHEVNGKNETVSFDGVFYWSDVPAVVKDTLYQIAGYLLFSMFSSNLHLDIPLPNFPAYGSNGNYVWPARDKLVPWADKKPRLVFRGQFSYKFGVDNWQSSPRIRLAQLAQKHPDLFDMGNTAYRIKSAPPLTHNPADLSAPSGIFNVTTIEQVVRRSNITIASKMTFIEQSGYKYLLDVDGGLGSSRVMATLASGSVPFLVESGWYNHIQQSLIPWVHYVPVSEHLGDLVAKVRWAQQNELEALRIVDNAVKFAERYASRQAAKEQLAEVLRRYHNLLAPDVKTDDSDVATDLCSTNTTR